MDCLTRHLNGASLVALAVSMIIPVGPAVAAQGVDCMETHKQALGILQSAQSKIMAQQPKTDSKNGKPGKNASRPGTADKVEKAATKTASDDKSPTTSPASSNPTEQADALKKEDFSARFGKAVKTLKEGQCKAQLQQLTDYVQAEQKKYPVAVPIED